MGADVAIKQATYADVLAAPETMVAELIYGVLETHPRPVPRHAVVAGALGAEITNSFQFGRSGPGGWIFMVEPELHLGDNVVVPDLAGWRRERMPTVPEDAFLTTPPDWVCEILSPRTKRLDYGPKRQIYGDHGVPFLWFVDPTDQTLEAFALVAGRWTLLAFLDQNAEVQVPPFDAISFPLVDLFPFGNPAA